jgi:hypothetical protein
MPASEAAMLVPALALTVLLAHEGTTTEPEAIVRSSQESNTAAIPARLTEAAFAARVDTYMKIHRAAEDAAPPLRVTADTREIRQAVEALALGIRLRRPDARQGDVFGPEIAEMVRRAVRESCQGQYLQLLALINEELDSPLAPPVVHGRWFEGAPLPTMWPELLAALPRLPGELEYRFINRDLVLLDIDANLIVDFVPDAIPAITSTSW